MKITAKTTPSCLAICLLGTVIGGLAWEVVERVAGSLGISLNLSVGPIGFDLRVVSLHFLVNPGTFLGLMAGILLFRML